MEALFVRTKFHKIHDSRNLLFWVGVVGALKSLCEHGYTNIRCPSNPHTYNITRMSLETVGVWKTLTNTEVRSRSSIHEC